MKRSAAWSSSSVVTPGRALLRSIVRQRASTWPAASIRSISSGDFLTIMLQRSLEVSHGSDEPSKLVLEPERCDGRANVVVHLARRARGVEAPQDALLVVVVHERRRLLVVDLEPPLDRL